MAPRQGPSARQGVIFQILFVAPCLETPGRRAWTHASAPLDTGKRKSRPIPGGRTPSPPENGNFIEICKNMLHSPKKRGILFNNIKSGHRKPLPPSDKLKSFFGSLPFSVGWVNSLDGTALAPLQVFSAVPEPPFSAPSELACLMFHLFKFC